MNIEKFVVVVIACTALMIGMDAQRARCDEMISSACRCPQNLSHLLPEMEKILQSISAQEFKDVIRSSLTASIPQAIEEADGINEQITYLRQEIYEQARLQRYVERIAREASNNPSEALKPCRDGERGSYCSSVERYYMALATNLANRAFLETLECYSRGECGAN